MKLNVYKKHSYQDIMTHNFVLVALLFMHRQLGLLLQNYSANRRRKFQVNVGTIMKEMTTPTVTFVRNSGSLTLKRVAGPRCRNSTVVRAGLVAHAFQDYVYPNDHTQPT